MRVRLARCWVLLPCAILLIFLTACGAGQSVAISAPAPLPTARILREPEALLPLRPGGAPEAPPSGSAAGGPDAPADSAAATASPRADGVAS
ncbi:MAG: hypothetical protein SNJ69_18585, partial [Chloroflexaceae bacterium]